MRHLVVVAVLGAAALGVPDPARLVLRASDLQKGYTVLRANTGRVNERGRLRRRP